MEASGIAAGAVLEQMDNRGKPYPVGYGSKKFTPAQQRWDTGEQEAFAALWGLAAKPLEYRLSGTLGNPNVQVCLYATPVYKPGPTQVQVDALSCLKNPPQDDLNVSFDIPTTGNGENDAAPEDKIPAWVNSFNACKRRLQERTTPKPSVVATFSGASWDDQEYRNTFRTAQRNDPELLQIFMVLENKVEEESLSSPEWKEYVR
ncbi:hypothetical protein M427DRAFT_34980 [Gonapodya prolifera JEL478]|uniref:Reverse transcriptase RNase H-like domain-containing protein n=1 Tax=Gonapodya prolifera (strain JEL478) TaxID=1344416 RepID=A0A139A5Y5_GONPJ|nr:hypothetical protein M427DRAFT_34980 [Gonapodya prolifera JEL478]|eukprot:KXS12069.1 hypothetical protein M427DRAFT_34980 [Gonapodya prolifera JEL478]